MQRAEDDDALSGAGRGILDYIEQCCDHPTVRERLHPRIDAVRHHIELHERRFTALDEQIALVHSDYNTKNLLAARDERGEWHITVLDWEFAFAGSPMMDLGNFLRFEHELQAVDAFDVVGRAGGGGRSPA